MVPQTLLWWSFWIPFKPQNFGFPSNPKTLAFLQTHKGIPQKSLHKMWSSWLPFQPTSKEDTNSKLGYPRICKKLHPCSWSKTQEKKRTKNFWIRKASLGTTRSSKLGETTQREQRLWPPLAAVQLELHPVAHIEALSAGGTVQIRGKAWGKATGELVYMVKNGVTPKWIKWKHGPTPGFGLGSF